jgi:hypothetical protein
LHRNEKVPQAKEHQMERRKAITTAAAASLTLLAGATGIALNSGILGASGDDDDVGNISPVDATAATDPANIVYVDQPATAPAAVIAAAPVQATNSQPVTTSAASGSPDDGRREAQVDDGDEREDDSGDEHEDGSDEHDDDGSGEHEYEGADDDD